MMSVVQAMAVLQLLFLPLGGCVAVTENGSWHERSNIGDNLEKEWNRTKAVSTVKEISVADNRGSVYIIQSDQKCLKYNLWFVWDNQNHSCHCGNDLYGVVVCDMDTNTLLVSKTACLTIEHILRGQQVPVVGTCLFNPATHKQGLWYIMYHNVSADCGSLNRQGTLCGQCLDGYTVPAYSYDLKCIRCDSQLENWGLYIVFAFLPLTVFIVITLVFRINVLSPELNMFVLAAQLISAPFFVREVLINTSSQTKMVANVILTLYGIWNLDFFRVNVLPDVCINAFSPNILILDYLVAIYPMLLVATAYIIVQLHDSGFRPLLYMWKPFHRFFARFRRQWGIQTTLMDAFVTFFFLSTTKLFSVSFSLLSYTLLYKSDGKQYSLNLFYDPNIKYFSREHLPYALLALGILIVFIVFPTSLLLCYHCKVYQKCLTKCHIRGPTLDEFVDTFQKYYKDSSNGSWDCRWFAGIFIFLKAFLYLSYTATPSSNSLFFLVMFAFVVGATIVVVVQPYKEEYSVFNIICANFFLWAALGFVLLAKENLYVIFQMNLSDHYLDFAVLCVIPLLYIIGVAVYHCIRRFRGQKGDDVTSSLPDRLLHSDQYRDSFGFIAAS